MKRLPFIFFISLLHFLVFNICNAVDTVSPSQFITGLVSSGGRFELGLFPTGNSKAWYLGIWYKNFPNTVVWVANREKPIPGSNGAFTLTKNGSLVLLDQMNNTIWSSSSSTIVEDPVAQLLETGNLVVRDKATTGSERYVWQSFDFPTDTWLEGMKLGWDFRTGLNRFLTSWKNASDPSLGEYTCRIVILALPQIVVAKGSTKKFRSGPWNGNRFTGFPLSNNSILTTIYVYDTNELYESYKTNDPSLVTRVRLTELGEVQRLVLNEGSTEWDDMYNLVNDRCDSYGECGANGICKINNSPICDCLKGFVPKSQQEWEVLNWTSGCIRKTPLICQKGDGFLRIQNVKLPDTLNFGMGNTRKIKECKAECLKNCSCVAYAIAEGCLMWFGDLVDMRELTVDISVQDIYIRMPASELGDSSEKEKRVVLIAVISAVCVLLFLGLSCWCIIRKKKQSKRGSRSNKENMELPLFDFQTIAAGTSNFSRKNILGEGGFGPVYKAYLGQEQVVAVKRLSKDSGQGEERMLIYEYMPNKSLDSVIFDQNRKKFLNWQKRVDIIVGTARGLLYLHQDSRLRIIHRDLKSSNILLDNELNPKISDFGIARIFGLDQTEGKTKRVIGTYGYMSPEYAIDGNFSVKSDVFSFGVLLLEIVSGRGNRGFHHPDHHHSLLGHAWLLWNKQKSLELLDRFLEDSYVEFEVLRCIQVGLLCVQKLPSDRPVMSSVVFMLSNEGATLPEPKEPGFFTERSSMDGDTLISNGRSNTGDVITITTMEAR
ncbi:hypothetical protein M0R45_015044 [Rubus argutus]|uniref:Receptor-like serine/threonine-protein kinase n=1 Tax=Rubus argutus TaxID=59490 RepID=A0AAW1XQV2_RUBAR